VRSDSSNFRTNAGSTLIFLHIHKTAGTALHKIIRRQNKRSTVYSKHGFFPQKFNDSFKELPAAMREKLRYVKAPMYFGLHESLSQPSTYVTMLRDPIDRVISHYYMVLQTPADVVHNDVTSQRLGLEDFAVYNEVKSRRMSLEDFARSGLLAELENGQTRFLSGTGPEVGFGQCSNEALEKAKKISGNILPFLD